MSVSPGPIVTPTLPSISVAMAAYNGSVFLGEQLASIAAQVYPPLELVVCDDGSTDTTVDVIERFASTSQLDVRLYRNPQRLGPCKNFMQAARSCRGDLIAFSDQDDVWRADKLAICAAEFAADPQVVMVMHSGTVSGTHTRGRPGRYPAYRRRVVASPASLPLNLSFPGFAQVFRRDLLVCLDYSDELLDEAFGYKHPQHDGWIGIIAAAFGKVVLLPEDLVAYRQHEANLWGAPNVAGARERIAASSAWRGKQEDLLRTARAARVRATVIDDLASHHFRSSAPLAVGAASSAQIRAAMWNRSATINERRSELYGADTASLTRLSWLAFNVVRGDYRSRRRGGSGLPSLVRDALHSTGLLAVGSTTSKLIAAFGRRPSDPRDSLGG